MLADLAVELQVEIAGDVRGKGDLGIEGRGVEGAEIQAVFLVAEPDTPLRGDVVGRPDAPGRIVRRRRDIVARQSWYW